MKSAAFSTLSTLHEETRRKMVSAKLAELLLLLHHADALVSDRGNDSRHCEDAADDRTQLRDDMSVRIKC